MKYYIEACREDDSRKLGNCDGQTVLRCKNYQRTNYYKKLKSEGVPCENRIVSHWVVVGENGNVLEKIDNPNYNGKNYPAYRDWMARNGFKTY